LVERPIVADFDEDGRLYVADSSGSNEKVEVQLQKRPHRIVRLEDSKNDGQFDKATTFADKMMFPEGALWHAGSLYVAAPPSIWKLTDTTGAGVADRREEWFQGQTLTGCANDLHGPYLGPDGWIYWCKGAFAQQTHERAGREPLVTKAAHIFRARPDGSGREVVMTGGMDNPVEVAFTPTGELLFTTTFIQHPGGGRRDAIVHAIYGGVYGKENSVLDGHLRTSPDLMPVMTHLGPAAPSGLCCYESTTFGSKFEGNLFVAQFNMRKVSRHVLIPDYGTFRTENCDFLVSDSFDFHPTDVLEDADGSLLVIDTGGWYKLCCPTAQLAKPDVLGAIYRVRRVGAPPIDDPRGQKLNWSNPKIEWLDDPRPAVRRRAIAALASRGVKSLSELSRALEPGRPAQSKCNAIWALTRIDDAVARSAVRELLHDKDDAVVQTAAHSASVTRDKDAAPALSALLAHGSLTVRRVAAETLGRVGSASDVRALLAALEQPIDRSVEHSLIFALIELSQREPTAVGLTSSNPVARRAALIALDQMRDGRLEAEVVVSAWRGDDSKLRETAAWILSRHPEWGDRLAGALGQRMRSVANLRPAERDELIQLLAKLARSPEIQALLAQAVRRPANDGGAIALAAMRAASLTPTPAAWLDAVLETLLRRPNGVSAEALDLIRSWKLSPDRAGQVAERLKQIARNPLVHDDLRMKSLAVLRPGALQQDLDLERWLFERVKNSEPIALRSPAADTIARGGFSGDQLLRLADVLPHVGPLELERVLDAFANCRDDRVGERLLTVLATMKPALRVGTLRPRLAKFGQSVGAQAEKLFRELDAESAKLGERLEHLLGNLKTGDIRRGQAVFNSQKAACFACHAVGYLGGTIGPDLTKIGAIRTERDLLESIVFPSASFVRGYEPISVMTKRGVPVNGLLMRDSPDGVVVTVSATEETRIPRGDIEAISPGTVSIMPAGLDQQLSEQDLADLIAFLKACR
jgi:putative membrane-bound dehydrogenase-like protein